MSGNKTSLFLAEMIGKLRVKEGESQQALADKLGVKRETVKFWESGERQIKSGDIVKIAQHFNVSTDYLLSLRDDPTPDVKLQDICFYTGLSSSAVEQFAYFNSFGTPFGKEIMEVINDFINNHIWGYAFLLRNMKFGQKEAEEQKILLTNKIKEKSCNKEEVYSVAKNIYNQLRVNELDFLEKSKRVAKWYTQPNLLQDLRAIMNKCEVEMLNGTAKSKS